MEDFSQETTDRAEALYRRAVRPLSDNLLGELAEYPVYGRLHTLWHISRRNDCRGVIEALLQPAGISNEADAIAYMDELEPKLLRWQAEMLEIAARARADVRAKAEALAGAIA